MRLRELKDLPSLQGSKDYNQLPSYPGTFAPNHFSRLPSSLGKKDSEAGGKQQEEMQEETLNFGIPWSCIVHLYTQSFCFCFFPPVTEQATYSTSHLGCGNPDSSLFFCDDNQGNEVKPSSPGFLRSSSNSPRKEPPGPRAWAASSAASSRAPLPTRGSAPAGEGLGPGPVGPRPLI